MVAVSQLVYCILRRTLCTCRSVVPPTVPSLIVEGASTHLCLLLEPVHAPMVWQFAPPYPASHPVPCTPGGAADGSG